jgi:AcrR family transcriptional regulator
MTDDMRDRIVNASKGLFARYGYRKTSLQDIADEARMGKSSLYYYFPTKEEIFRAVVLSESRQIQRRVRAAIKAADTPEAKIRAELLTRGIVAEEMHNAYAALREEWLDHLGFIKDVRRQIVREEVAVIRELLSQGVDAGRFAVDDLDTTAESIMLASLGMFDVLATECMEGDLRVRMNALADLVVNALLRPEHRLAGPERAGPPATDQ